MSAFQVEVLFDWQAVLDAVDGDDAADKVMTAIRAGNIKPRCFVITPIGPTPRKLVAQKKSDAPTIWPTPEQFWSVQ